MFRRTSVHPQVHHWSLKHTVEDVGWHLLNFQLFIEIQKSSWYTITVTLHSVVCQRRNREPRAATSHDRTVTIHTYLSSSPYLLWLNVKTNEIGHMCIPSARDIAVGTATRYGMDDTGSETRFGALFSGPIQTGSLSRAYQTEHSIAELQTQWK